MTLTTDMTIEQKVETILKQFGLDFEITKSPLVALMPDSEVLPTNFFGLVNSKSKETLSTVKKGYQVSQNADVVKLVLTGIEKFADVLSVHKAGSLNGGKQVYIQLAIEGFETVATDTIKRYLTVIDSNDGSCSLSVGIGDVTLSCMNQFSYFYGKAQSKFRHSASLQQKMVKLPQMIEEALGRSMQQIEIYRNLAAIELSQNNIIDAMVNEVLGYDKHYTSVADLSKKSKRAIEKMETLYEHIQKEIDQKGATAWGLFSGVTSYSTHGLKVRNRKKENAETESLLIGAANKLNQKALRFVCKMGNIQ